MHPRKRPADWDLHSWTCIRLGVTYSPLGYTERWSSMYRTGLYRTDLYRTDLRGMDVVEAAGTEVLSGHRAQAAPSWWQSVRPRLLVGGAWVVLVLFTYVLLSFHNPLQPPFTPPQAPLALALLGLCVTRA